MATPYRNDVEALNAELTALEAELARLGQGRRALEEAAHREEVVRAQIDTVQRRLRARRRTLTMLDDVRVASPCSADWESMTGDERSRFCGSCKKDVFDLSGMTRVEAETFVRERSAIPDETCIRFYRRADGTIMTSDCAVGVARGRRRKIAAAAVGATLAAAGAALAFAGGSGSASTAFKLPAPPRVDIEEKQQDPRPHDHLVMGRMAPSEMRTPAEKPNGPRSGLNRKPAR